MARSLSALLEDADALISSKVSSNVKVASSSDGDDIFKMAEWVRKGGDPVAVKEAASEESFDDVMFTLEEKVAHAKAILETVENLPILLKMSNLEKSAKEKGYSDSQIESYLEKNAAQFPLKSIMYR